MAKGFCAVLCEFFGLQERLRITVDIDHVPGSPNDVADAPNRDANPSDLGFLPSPAFHLVCAELSAPLQLQLFPSADFFRGYFASCDICRCLKVLGAVPLSGQASGLTPFGPTAPFHLEPVSDRTFRMSELIFSQKEGSFVDSRRRNKRTADGRLAQTNVGNFVSEQRAGVLVLGAYRFHSAPATGLNMLFFSFFRTLVDRNVQVTVELKNDLCITGTLQSADQFLNLKLANARTYRLQIERGSVVRYVHLPGHEAAVFPPDMFLAPLDLQRSNEMSCLDNLVSEGQNLSERPALNLFWSEDFSTFAKAHQMDC
ncbi:putative U6 snRNA-associated Sm-like protein LSm2 [Symbiodinium microadriaticum]|uniref:Putative U6 snRNA-associated Sm-like protein LSm2 n=1 Tax=Symbiodinium microadriaticum TaxID=2951 RepID=A0A1Q9ENV0_SYMMI|nr:putative U6 snRNA-associated Sm-like protein LSm2 [Symbiodinium microadriaticum]